MIDVLAVPGTVTFLIGGLGAGKTELALNLALWNARHPERGKPFLLDLDIVNPFFRVRRLRDEMEKAGVTLITPPQRIENSDLPALSGRVWTTLEDPAASVVCDVGGGEVGLRPLARLKEMALRRVSHVLFVVNPYRPGFLSEEQFRESFRIMSELSALTVTHLVANPHLSDETTPEVFLDGMAKIRLYAEAVQLPIAFAIAATDLLTALHQQKRLQPFEGNDVLRDAAPGGLFRFQDLPLLGLSRFWETPWKFGIRKEEANA